MDIDIGVLKKSTLKIKGNIDVNESTYKKIEELSKLGVQTNVLVSAILDKFDFDSVINELKSENQA